MNNDDMCACNNTECPNNPDKTMSDAAAVVKTAADHIAQEMMKNKSTVYQINGTISQGLKTKLEERGFTACIVVSPQEQVYTIVSAGPLMNYE